MLRDSDVLSGWQEVADYLGVCTRTAQRYSKTGGLPVKYPAGRGKRPFASKAELDDWWMQREQKQEVVL